MRSVPRCLTACRNSFFLFKHYPRSSPTPLPPGRRCPAGCPLAPCRPVRLSVWWPYGKLTHPSAISPRSVLGQGCPDACWHSESSSPRRPRAVARVAGGVSAAAGPGRSAGVRSNFRHEVPKRGHLGDCADSMARATQRGTAGRNGQAKASTGHSHIRRIRLPGSLIVARLAQHILARASARAFRAAYEPSPPLLPFTFPTSRAAQRRALTS
jgi:hypothetical protein